MSIATLDEMRAIVRSQQQAEADAKEAEGVAAERGKEAAYKAAVEKLGRFIPESVLNGHWTVQPTTLKMTSWRDGELSLRSTFLPDDIPPLLLLGNWFRTDGGRGPENLQLERQGTSSSIFLCAGMPAERVMGLLAPLVVKYVEEIESVRQLDERRQRFEAARDARQARIDGKLDEMEALYSRVVTMDLDRIEAAWGWPQNRTLTVYRIEWTTGVDHEGNVSTDNDWSLTADPCADGFYEFLSRGKLVRRKITSPTVIATEWTWSSVDHLPAGLRENVTRTRVLRVYEWQGSRMTWVAERRVYEKRQIPGLCLRRQMGFVLPDDIPSDTLPYSESVGAPLVATVMTDSGFEPWEPVETAADDDDEELPY